MDLSEIFGTDVPPASILLGWTLLALDREALTIRVGFTAKPEFANPLGVVQGGFQTAMLDDSFGPLAHVAAGGRARAATIDINVAFLRPVRPGPIECAARVVRAGRAVAFLEGELFDGEGRLGARATASFILSPRGGG